MKRTYVNRLPKNEEVKNTNVRVKNGQIFVDVEFKEKFEPKDGDFLVSKWGCVFIYSNKKPRDKFAYSSYCGVSRVTNIIYLEFSDNWTNKEGCRYATPKEKVDFLKRLEKEWSKRWNPETKELEDIRWKPKEGELFWYVGIYFDVYNTHYVSSFNADFSRVKTLNCFRTEEAAKKVANQIKEIFKNSKAE